MKPVTTVDGLDLVLDVVDRRQGESQVAARIYLELSHVQAVRDETWFRGLRAGVLGPDLEACRMRVMVGEDRGGGRRQGYDIELTDGDRAYRRHFTLESLASIARQKVLELVQREEAKLDDTYNYHLAAVPTQERDVPPPLVARSRSAGLQFERARLAEYLARSEPLVGASAPPEPPAEPRMEIFTPREVWQQGRDIIRRGGQDESAALFTGRLCQDLDSPEVFVVFDACLEAAHAVEDKLSVTFTGETWDHIRGRLETRRRRLGRPHEILVGSVHTHPFKPSADAEGRRTCEACAVAQYCSRSTAVPSTDDWDFHRSVFAGQPWASLLIHGFNAREQEDWRLYGIENGQFRERTLRLLKD